MFSDRYLALKGAAAITALILLLGWSGLRMHEFKPSIQDCREDPERFRGREVYVGVARVTEVAEGKVVVIGEKTPIPILGPHRGLEVGDWVTVLGEFQPPDAILGRRWAKHPGYLWKRAFMYLFSGGALLFLVGLLARRYRIVIGLPMMIPKENGENHP